MAQAGSTSELLELFETLKISSENQSSLKVIALDYIKGLTANNDGRKLFKDDRVLRQFGQLLIDSGNTEVAYLTFQCFVNLSADADIAKRLVTMTSPCLIEYLIQYALEENSVFADYSCKVLSNLTHFDENCFHVAEVLQSGDSSIQLDHLVHVFCQIGFNKKGQSLDYIGPLLSNLTQVESIRLALLDPHRCLIQRILPFTEYSGSLTRRGGIAGTLKNCCFQTEKHEWLTSTEVDIIPRLVLPLAGNEQFDDDDMDKLPVDLQYLPDEKTREPDPDIRKILLESLYQLCATTVGRQYMKQHNVYVVLRELDKWETDPSAKAVCINVIEVLIGDEPEPGMENLRTVDIPSDVMDTFNKT